MSFISGHIGKQTYEMLCHFLGNVIAPNSWPSKINSLQYCSVLVLSHAGLYLTSLSEGSSAVRVGSDC